MRASRRSRTLSGGGKAKPAVDVAVAYVENVLGLTTQPSEFAADRSRSLFSDSLLCFIRLCVQVLYPSHGGGVRDFSKKAMVKTSKASFQVNGFGGAKLVRAKEMCQFGIILVDQGAYFLNAE